MSYSNRQSRRELHRTLEGLRRRCLQTIPEIVAEQEAKGATVYETIDGPIIHRVNGSSVLGVAHMDYVPVPYSWKIDYQKQTVRTPRLDDRLGIWILLDVLPSFGINLDILLTDSEEIGRTTAKKFARNLPIAYDHTCNDPKYVHPYNWLVEFDRRGDQVVLYDYDSDDTWRKLIAGHGFTVGHGSFSDIAALVDLRVCGMNIGVGYHHEHTPNCFCDLSQLAVNLNLFRSFYESWSNVKFEFTPEPEPTFGFGGYDYDYGGSCDYSAFGLVTETTTHEWVYDRAKKRSVWKRKQKKSCCMCHSSRVDRDGDLCLTCTDNQMGYRCKTCQRGTVGLNDDNCFECERDAWIADIRRFREENPDYTLRDLP